MNLFGYEQTEISKIYTVDKYANYNKDIKEYHNCFHTYELIYFLSGSNKTLLDGVTLNDCPDSLRYIPKTQTTGAYRVEPIDAPSVCIDIYFDVSTPMPMQPLILFDCNELRDKFIRLYSVWKQKGTGYYSEAMKLFYDIICYIQRTELKYLPPVQKKYMERAYNYILRHYRCKHFDYNELCNSTGLKYAHFSTLFVKAFGMSPVRLVTKMKIDYAKELLVTNRFSVSEIAEMCGFDNTYYFSNVFKKQTGFSPTKYLSEIYDSFFD